MGILKENCVERQQHCLQQTLHVWTAASETQQIDAAEVDADEDACAGHEAPTVVPM